jgi:hypothetical protein
MLANAGATAALRMAKTANDFMTVAGRKKKRLKEYNTSVNDV